MIFFTILKPCRIEIFVLGKKVSVSISKYLVLFKKVSVSLSENLVSEKSPGIGFGKFGLGKKSPYWYEKNLSRI